MPDSHSALVVSHTEDTAGNLSLTLTFVSGNGLSDNPVQLPQAVKDAVTVARYADFNLVKPFFRFVLRCRPSSVVFDELCADTADLLRMLVSMGVPVTVSKLPEEIMESQNTAILGQTEQRWCEGLRQVVESLSREDNATTRSAGAVSWGEDVGYEEYAFGSRSHSLLILWVERVLRFFEGRGPVLDVGCGTGVFLDQLTRRGIDVVGVDSNQASICYARSMGLSAETADGADYLQKHPQAFDAIHCSHLVEHLSFEDLKRFFVLVARALRPGGRAVFVFPDPESIRSQLLGFWRDPDHVRFYHPDSIGLLAASCGLELEFNSQHEVGRTIVPFPMVPPQSTDFESVQELKEGELLETLVSQLVSKINQHEQWIRHLWQVNQTWAWADDAVLVFSRPSN